jgi:hypothetical protein
MKRQGLKIAHIEQREIRAAAQCYFEQYRAELIQQAAETVRLHPKLRTLAEREQRKREREQRCQIQRQQQRNEHCVGSQTQTIALGNILLRQRLNDLLKQRGEAGTRSGTRRRSSLPIATD